jgi:maltooligosyltrehalose trehalohydrolase
MAQELGRRVLVIAESDANDPTLVRERPSGYGLDAMWSDDFHHAIHTLLTGEKKGYYQDFGRLEQLGRALEEGFIFQGEHFNFWNRPRGSSAKGVPLERNIFCIQNHDQVGNRALGERLTQLAPMGACKLAAALLLLAPETPLLFMGEEYGEQAPFQFFTSYGDPQLAKAVSEGRRHEFEDFAWEEVPDPQHPATFERSKLKWAISSSEMLRWYRQLIALRKKIYAKGERRCEAEVIGEGMIRMQTPEVLVIAAFRSESALPNPGAGWKLQLANDEDGYRVSVYAR